MLDFPASPTVGQTFQNPLGSTWQWDGVKWTPQTATSPIIATNVGRNLVMNGAFAVAQRGAGPWTTTTYTYTTDRWVTNPSGGDSLTVSQRALTDAERAQIGDEAAAYCLNTVFAGGSGAAMQTSIFQPIESVRRLAGKTITISFWAISTSGSTRLGVNIAQYFGSGGSPSAGVQLAGQLFAITTSWARYSATFTLPSISGKTLGTNGGDHTYPSFWFSAGANNAANSGNIGVQSGTIALYGCQVETGSVMTPFDAGGTPQQQLAACQRFYQPITASIRGNATAVQNWGCSLSWQPMRALPTITLQSGGTISNVQALSSGSAAPYNGSSGYFNVVAAAAGDFYALSVPFVLSADL